MYKVDTLQHYHYGIKNENWKFESFDFRIYKTPNWIQSIDKIILGIGLVLSIGLISSISLILSIDDKLEGDSILR